MKKEMLINVLQPEECRIAIVEDGVLEELYVERTSQESYVGNIYKGRIVNIEPSIQAAFVDFGIGRNGFLHVSDVDPAYYKHLDQPRGDARDRDRGDRDRCRRGRGRGDAAVAVTGRAKALPRAGRKLRRPHQARNPPQPTTNPASWTRPSAAPPATKSISHSAPASSATQSCRPNRLRRPPQQVKSRRCPPTPTILLRTPSRATPSSKKCKR